MDKLKKTLIKEFEIIEERYNKHMAKKGGITYRLMLNVGEVHKLNLDKTNLPYLILPLNNWDYLIVTPVSAYKYNQDTHLTKRVYLKGSGTIDYNILQVKKLQREYKNIPYSLLSVVDNMNLNY